MESRIQDQESEQEIVYNWESSIPEAVKSKRIGHFRHISCKHSKSPSIEYLRFSDKVLREYSKNQSRSYACFKSSFIHRKNSHSNEIYNDSKPLVPKVKFQLPKFRSTASEAYVSRIAKGSEIKNFKFGLSDNKSSGFLIHQYSIPNGVIHIKTRLKQASKPNEVSQNSNPNLRQERKGLLGQKIRFNKNCKMNT